MRSTNPATLISNSLSSRVRIILTVTAAMLAVVTVVTAQAASASTSRASQTEYYVSLGDSYAAGYQPIAIANSGTDANGFAYQVVGLAAKKGHHFALENFACDGATTASLLDQDGCSLTSPGPDTVSYKNLTQAAAAEQFIATHRGQIALITISIGGNDLLACSAAQIVISCARGAAKQIAKNLSTLLTGLRGAAGVRVPIIGLTYPDIFLGLFPSKTRAQKKLATLSITEFRNIFNPALRATYQSAGARFLDVTAATGAYTPLTKVTNDPPYGVVPKAVADVCRLTYYCELQDVHPRTAGYAVMARLIVATLTKTS